MAEPKPIRILITGSRTISSAGAELVRQMLNVCRFEVAPYHPVVIVHGAARGVDTVAAGWATETSGAEPEPHPANWILHGTAAGPIRNQAMVDLGAHICLAFPAKGSIGTWDCLKRAALAGIPGRVHPLVGVA